MSEIKNTMDWINRLDRTEEKISEPKDIERETSENKGKKKLTWILLKQKKKEVCSVKDRISQLRE